MFDPSRAIAAAFETFGRVAVVQETTPRAIRAVYRAPDETERFGSRDVITTSMMLEVRRADMAGIIPGTRILIGDEMRIVRGEPQYRDAERLVAHLHTVPDRP